MQKQLRTENINLRNATFVAQSLVPQMDSKSVAKNESVTLNMKEQEVKEGTKTKSMLKKGTFTLKNIARITRGIVSMFMSGTEKRREHLRLLVKFAESLGIQSYVTLSQGKTGVTYQKKTLLFFARHIIKYLIIGLLKVLGINLLMWNLTESKTRLITS